MSREAFIRAPLFLDPFIPLDDALADRLYGRVVKLGQGVTMRRNAVWILLARNMYSVLVGETQQQGLNTAMPRKPKKPSEVRSLSGASLRNWAKAFNIAVLTQYKADKFKKPRPIDTKIEQSSWEPPIQVRSGRALEASWNKYVIDPEGRLLTGAILKRFEEFRLAVAADLRISPTLQLNAD